MNRKHNNNRRCRHTGLIAGRLFALLIAMASTQAAVAQSTPAVWHYRAYLDTGYGASDNRPENNLWRSKSTTFQLDSPQLNLAMAMVNQEASPGSRWGMEFGLQGGVDVEKQVPDNAVANARSLRHLYRGNATYLFDAGSGLRLTGGLINSYIGYESFLAIENPNYTRAYILDTVPYFLVGAEAAYAPSALFEYALYLVTGYEHLEDSNNRPSLGLQLRWQLQKPLAVTQNFYYGPDQSDTSIEFWRFLTDTIVEWKTGRLLLAAALDVGTEKQAEVAGQPRYDWLAAAAWARWLVGDRWSLALRPELLRDPDGLAIDARQTIHALTATAKYTFISNGSNKLVGSIEYRHDRSTGDQGGFYSGSDNELVETQNLLLFGVNLSYGQ